LCETDEGRETCEAIERAWRLSVVEQATIAAVESKAEHRYPVATVRVGLFRIEGKR
jgi:hypothetical protein